MVGLSCAILERRQVRTLSAKDHSVLVNRFGSSSVSNLMIKKHVMLVEHAQNL